MGIVESGKIWASEVKYLNDADELTHLAAWIRSEVAVRSDRCKGPEREIMDQFQTWSRERLTNGHMLFVTAFTENGNLLSQWRGYCPFGKGVSIGFSQAKIAAVSQAAEFSLGPCIYDSETQGRIVADIVDGVVEEGLRQGPTTAKHASQCYYHVFEELEPLILRISALVKNRSFKEEKEWRLVSPIHTNFAVDPIKYREGSTMLIPYLEIPLHWGADEVDIEHLYIGPTPTPNLSLTSAARYLRKHVNCPRISNSMSPFRG